MLNMCLGKMQLDAARNIEKQLDACVSRLFKMKFRRCYTKWMAEVSVPPASVRLDSARVAFVVSGHHLKEF